MENLKERFKCIYPDKYYLDYSVEELDKFLRDRGWILPGEMIDALEIPGEGNMNRVLRVMTNKRSFIIKQARPWVEKYPEIDAPVERNGIEAKYYAQINRVGRLHEYSPDLDGIDENHFTMILSDLGRGMDYTFLYNKGILQYLSHLHDLHPGDFPSNRSMRKLNHEHIFLFPFSEDNGLNLNNIQPGLQKLALKFIKDISLKDKIRALGELYLSEGVVLIHGDYFPGSWLKTPSGLKVIDPEFSFTGYAEFDIGVLVAHMFMAEQDEEIVRAILFDSKKTANMELVAEFAGTEVLRRLLGIAQLPLSLSLEQKSFLANRAKAWIIDEQIDIT
jgi:5-methylthioribose kinase